MKRCLALLLPIAVAVLAAVPASASAQAGARFPTVLLTARTSGGGFSGQFEIRRFRVRGPGLVGFGRLNGRLRDRRFPSTQRVRNRTFSFPVALARVPGTTSCARLALVLGGRTAPLLGLAATFAPRTLVLRPRARAGPGIGELLCGASAAVGVNAPPAVTVHLLNALRLQYA